MEELEGVLPALSTEAEQVNEYTVTITSPSGETRDLSIDAGQVRYFEHELMDPFAAAAYLAYCDLWTQE